MSFMNYLEYRLYLFPSAQETRKNLLNVFTCFFITIWQDWSGLRRQIDSNDIKYFFRLRLQRCSLAMWIFGQSALRHSRMSWSSKYNPVKKSIFDINANAARCVFIVVMTNSTNSQWVSCHSFLFKTWENTWSHLPNCHFVCLEAAAKGWHQVSHVPTTITASFCKVANYHVNQICSFSIHFSTLSKMSLERQRSPCQ